MVGNLELSKRAEYCEFFNIEVCRITSKIEYFDCGKHLNDEDSSDFEEQLYANLMQCICNLDHDYYVIRGESFKQCGFDDNLNDVTPEALQSSMCSVALRATESSYIEDYVSSIEAEQSQAWTDTEGWHHFSDYQAFEDIYSSNDYSSQVSLILKSMSDSQRTSESTKSSTSTTRKGSSSNIAVTVGCGSLFSLVLLSLL